MGQTGAAGMAGAVRPYPAAAGGIWTASAEQATRALRDRRPPSPARARSGPGQEQPGSAAGRTLMRTEDF